MLLIFKLELLTAVIDSLMLVIPLFQFIGVPFEPRWPCEEGFNLLLKSYFLCILTVFKWESYDDVIQNVNQDNLKQLSKYHIAFFISYHLINI